MPPRSSNGRGEVSPRPRRSYLSIRPTKKAGVYDGTINHLRDVYCGTKDGKIKPTRDWKKLAAESKRDYKRYIGVICERLGTDQVHDIDAEVVAALHESYSDRPYAGNQCVTVLGTMIGIAIAKPSLFPKMVGRATSPAPWRVRSPSRNASSPPPGPTPK